MGKHQKGKRPGTNPSGHSLANIVVTPLLYHLKVLFFSDKTSRTSSLTTLPLCQGAGLPLRTSDILRFVSSLRSLPRNLSAIRFLAVPQLQFSFAVIQFRFSARLSDLSSLMWFTQGLFSGLGTKASATSLLTRFIWEWFLSLYRLTLKYPLGFIIGRRALYFSQRQCLTLPSVETW